MKKLALARLDSEGLPLCAAIGGSGDVDWDVPKVCVCVAEAREGAEVGSTAGDDDANVLEDEKAGGDEDVDDDSSPDDAEADNAPSGDGDTVRT